MQHQAASDDRQAQPAKGALAAMFGLDPVEAKTMGRVFAEIMRGLGLNGERIFKRLDKGLSLAKALDLPEGTVDLLYARAHQWFGVGRTDKAEPLFRTLCMIDGAADHWVGYGVCLSLRGAEQEAASSFEAACRLRPDWAVPHFHLAGLAIRLGAMETAARSLARFDATVTPDLPPAIISEAARLRVALALQREQAGTGRTSSP